jgi:hypothetical protein
MKIMNSRQLYLKKGKKYHPATRAEMFLAGMEVMREVPKLRDVVASLENSMLFGEINLGESVGPGMVHTGKGDEG